MTRLEAKLMDALLATAKLREEGERLVADVEPGSDRSDRRFPHRRLDIGDAEPSSKLSGGRAEHEVASRPIVKGEVATAAHSAIVSRRSDNALASIGAKERD